MRGKCEEEWKGRDGGKGREKGVMLRSNQSCLMRIRKHFVDNGCVAISVKSFAEWTRRHLHDEIGLPAAVEINERTATRWLHVLSYNLGDSSRKGTYFDGHEHADVVEYRKMFLLWMEGY